jgi:glucose/arabinose dehydrogenase
MMKQILLLLTALIFSNTLWASKAREKALSLDGARLDAIDRLRYDPGFVKVDQKAPALPLNQLKVPEGYELSLFAVAPDAREITKGEKGVIYVGTRTDRVYRIHDSGLKGKADTVEILAQGLNNPNGVAYKDGTLYIAEIQQVSRIQNVGQATLPTLKLEKLPQKFPSDQHHGWKFIRFGPDGWLYVPVGANCNVCDIGTQYGRLFRIDVNSDKKEVVATGIRNTVGFDWDPSRKELWFTDNGRDLMGDDTPPDELNKVSKMGENFGFPYCHGKNIQDPGFKQKKCSESTRPQWEFPAHIAALGMRFWDGKIVVAEHGSWNRSQPQGYRISLVDVEKGKATKYTPWIQGWLQGAKHWGRPVDVEVYFDGSLLISDDDAGVIYRLQKKAP